jgi:peptidoglycan/xylan/chitin deacetylase (PgdA/CDA1 family)
MASSRTIAVLLASLALLGPARAISRDTAPSTADPAPVLRAAGAEPEAPGGAWLAPAFGAREFLGHAVDAVLEQQRRNRVTIVLTFDDGPDPWGRFRGAGGTEAVLDTLRENPVRPGIIGAFFVQARVPIRMGCRSGVRLVREEEAAGHVVAIHTGSRRDHVDHRVRVRSRCTEGETGANGLEADMRLAKERIAEVAGAPPQFVRAVGGATNRAVLDTYRRVGLQHIRWDVDSRDNRSPHPGPARVEQSLRSQITSMVRHGRRQLVVLFHDINPTTVRSLPGYLATIDGAVRAAGKIPSFPSSGDEVQQVFRRRRDE